MNGSNFADAFAMTRGKDAVCDLRGQAKRGVPHATAARGPISAMEQPVRRLVSRAPAHADRLAPLALTVIALAAFACGIALAFAVQRGEAKSEAPTPAAPRRERTTPNASAANRTPQPPSPAARDAGARAAVTPIPEPPSTPVDAAPARRRRTLVPGVVAYVQCKGAGRTTGRFPCPRDRALETEVWRALDGLTRCTGDDPGHGRLEARLTLQRDAPARIELRAQDTPNHAAGLDVRAVSKCAAPLLAHMRSTLPTPTFVAAFRFELR